MLNIGDTVVFGTEGIFMRKKDRLLCAEINEQG